MSFKKLLYKTYKNIAENVLPTLKKNDFSKTGLLTPKEFIIAGDYLVNKFPIWRWSSARKHKRVDYLPPDKQFLILKNIAYLDNQLMPNLKKTHKDNFDNEWNIYKLSEFEEKNMIDSDYSDYSDSDESENSSQEKFTDDFKDINKNTVSTKTYDVTITYDNYYRTPKIWFFGYTKIGMPMPYDKMLQDFSENHKKITVTVDKHPFLKVHCVNVHPCRHSDVMKSIIKIKNTNTNKMNKNKVLLEHYFIYFLKFVACIVPNMDFDFTISL